jgi:hypothetical protein
MSNLLKQFWLFQPIGEQQRWPLLLTVCEEKQLSTSRAVLTLPTSAETVNFVSRCVDGEIKLKQNTDGVDRSETKQNFVSVLFQFHFTCRTGFTRKFDR